MPAVESDEEIAARRLGQLVGGKWRLERLLGTGGMAAVYAASTPAGDHVALKLLHPEMTLKRDVRERFVREAYVGNKVQHPGAVKILEHGSNEGEAFLVMELLEGEPLGQRVRRLGSLPERELFGYLDQVLDVLAAAHAQGIIHRDIKPDNLFVLNDGSVKILDFGLARMLDDVPGEFKTRTGLALGTLPYMAPEQALGKRGQLDGRADVFALGATAFRILSKRRVHEADSEAELLVLMATKPAPPLASVAGDASAHACAIIDLSLAFSKDARYPDARTMQEDVRALLAGKEPPYAVGRGISAAREMPTRIDHVAPAAGAVAAAVSAESSAPSLPSVPHVIGAGLRGAGTAPMPAVEGRALPDEPTRRDMPGHAMSVVPSTEPLGAESVPASLSPASLPAASQMAATPPPHVGSTPPPAKKQSALPLVMLLLAAMLVLGFVGVGLFVVTQTDLLGSDAEAAAAAPEPQAPAPAAPALAAAPEDEEPAADGSVALEEVGDDPPKATATTTPRSKPKPASAPKPTATAKPKLAAPSRPTATGAATATAPPPPPPPRAPEPPAEGPGKGKSDDKKSKPDKHKGKKGD